MRFNPLVFNRVMSTLMILLLTALFVTPSQYSKIVMTLFFITFGGFLFGKKKVKTAIVFFIFAIVCFLLYEPFTN